MVIYCVHDFDSRWRGYYTTLERAKNVLWSLYVEKGWYDEDKENYSLMVSIKDFFNEEWRIDDVGSIEEIIVED